MGVNQPRSTPTSNIMLDTIKVAIPLTEKQHKKLSDIELSREVERWARVNLYEGSIDLVKVQGLVDLDNNSFHRQIMWDVKREWSEGSRLFIEFSVPKFWYGHNINLLYNWKDALHLLKGFFESQFKLTRMRLPDVDSWEVLRFDACYAWRFPSQDHAQAYLDNLKRLKFPYKDPTIRKESIFFPGATYSVKAYLKLPEFLKHDQRELIKQGVALEWVNHLENLASGVLRFEVTLRSQWLRRRGLKTVGHFTYNGAHILWDENCIGLSEEQQYLFVQNAALFLEEKEPGEGQRFIEGIMSPSFEGLQNALHLTLPKGTYSLPLPSGKQLVYEHPGGGFTVYRTGQALGIIQEMLKKFVGEGEMHSDNQVIQILTAFYKPDKEKKVTNNRAADLTAFWVFCQRFGFEKAKLTYGHNKFYKNRSDLKKAGIDLIERPENLVFIDENFWRSYRMKAPSEYVVNPVDDFRDGTNILNLPKQA